MATEAFVPGIGPTPCKYLILADAPNREDAAKRRPFSGRSGKELDRFFDNFHIPSRSRWYCTFLFKSQWDDKRPPAPEAIAQHATWLLEEIREVRPRVIVPMGKRALSWCLGDAHDIGDWHALSAPMPNTCPAFAIIPSATVFPCVSPGAAFASPELYRKFAVSMQRLEMLLKGDLPPRPLDDIEGHYEWLYGKAVSTLIQRL